MTTTVVAAAALALLAAGYVLGRWRPAPRLLDWAEDQQRGTIRYWLAQPILAVAIAAVYLLHPRRTAANVRSWREDQRRHPAPVRDPNWAEKRKKTRR
jgi:phosphate/sulfate permease